MRGDAVFESAELGHKVEKTVYDKQEPGLRDALLKAQAELLLQKRFPVVIIIGGVDGAGKGETVNVLTEWMDPRHIATHALADPTDEERARPEFWRYWRILPPKGKIGIFFGSWYSEPILQRVEGDISQAELTQAIERVSRFERMLTDEGALVLKFWFHLSKAAQKQRLKELESDKDTSWRVTKLDWQRFKLVAKFRETSAYVLRRTSSAQAPWLVVEGVDRRYRELTVGKALLDALNRRLQAKPAAVAVPAPVAPAPIDKLNLIRALRHDLAIDRKEYREELERLQGRLAKLTRRSAYQKLAVVAVFEGHDAAGKGGAIRRVTQAIDARYVRVVPVAAPSEEERAQPYLWRFWRQLPGRGQMTIFDRSWYGRVLVERVEGFAAEADWLRAYGEINDFEADMLRHRMLPVKFWLNISKAEQLKRFKERQATSYKRFKITAEDWRNRKKWDVYEQAVCDLVERTSTSEAPWTLVEADDKLYARIKILKTLCARIEAAL
jgi:AMP-polyphosphate phosphotransferase